jgi:hypothetical protein
MHVFRSSAAQFAALTGLFDRPEEHFDSPVAAVEFARQFLRHGQFVCGEINPVATVMKCEQTQHQWRLLFAQGMVWPEINVTVSGTLILIHDRVGHALDSAGAVDAGKD